MATKKIDLIEGGSIDIAFDYRQRTRMAFVYGLDTSNPALVLDLATRAPGMPQIGQQHPADPICRLTRQRVEGVSSDIAFVTLIYETPRAQGLYGTAVPKFVVRDAVATVSETTWLVPGTKEPLVVRYYDSSDKNNRLAKPFASSIDLPAKKLVFSGIVRKDKRKDIGDLVGTVNLKAWRGKPPGWWKFEGWTSETVDNGITYGVSVEFISCAWQDWSRYDFFKDPRTGIPYTVPDYEVKRLKALPYQHGIIKQSQLGLTRWGPYPQADFSRIFDGAGF
jgi:hypothetical protein